MPKKRVLSLILALSCTAALLGGCAGNDTSDDTTASGEHEVITMNAPYRNMSQFYDLVHEKYPEINLEIIPYNGENTFSYMKDMRFSGELPDIYSTTYYTPGRMDDEGDFLDLSGYDFMDNYTPSRLRDVSYNGGIYMLPMGYSAIGITYNKTLLDTNGWTLPTNLDELATLKDEVEAAGYVFSRCQLEYPGFGFQFMCAIASISFLSNLEIAIGRVRSNAALETDGSSVLSGMCFLCAEDNALNAEILEAIFEMYGASCTICPDSTELCQGLRDGQARRIRRRPDGHSNAAHERLRDDEGHPRRQKPSRQDHPHHRDDGQRLLRRHTEQHRRGHGRPHLQAHRRGHPRKDDERFSYPPRIHSMRTNVCEKHS